MPAENSIRALNLGKCYHIYSKPIDRLKQMLWRSGRKFYDEFWSIRKVNLDIFRGETIGFVGRNGAGKSTLLQLICGTLTPTEGEIQVNGRIFALLQLGAGFNPEFTGRENIFLAGSVLGMPEDEIKRRYPEILEFAGIGDFIEQPVKIYSSGMYARLAFAVAMHVDADVLIVDEILSVGDAAFTQKCMHAIRAFKQKGTLLFVSHDTNAVVNLCDRVVWLDSGEVREIGPAKEVCHNYLASVHNESEHSGSFHIGGTRKEAPRAALDPRHEELKNSQHRNEIQVFDFDANAPWFGYRGVTLKVVSLLGMDGLPIRSLLGGEEVRLRIVAEAQKDTLNPILGFYLKDRLGQRLFGDNTYLAHKNKAITLSAGEQISATFHFQMPYLASGDYAITPAIAEGTQENHVQHHWIDDALYMTVTGSHVLGGLIGIPMLSIDLECMPASHIAMGQSAGTGAHEKH